MFSRDFRRGRPMLDVSRARLSKNTRQHETYIETVKSRVVTDHVLFLYLFPTGVLPICFETRALTHIERGGLSKD